jgi:uncharacterized protein (TIGR02466 family)
MALKIAYFQPVILAIDSVPPVEFSKMYSLTENLHSHKELDDSHNPLSNIRGGQQIQVYPNKLDVDVNWLTTWLETICLGYMEIVTSQSGVDDLKLCKPVITSVWTIRQSEGDYQEMHSHPGAHISGNIYISAPQLEEGSPSSDSQVLFRLAHTRDVTKFIMSDTWKYTPEPGTVVIFPSHIPHTVFPWKGTGYRTVLSFDARLLPKEEVVKEILNGQS